MFVYLSKKISIPDGISLKSLSWNPDDGWIACGGDKGLLKVLKLELTARSNSRSPTQNAKTGVAAQSNLSMNQTLEGHEGKVMCVTWNALHRKLTTSDQTGLIIVWMLHKGTWFEEMINNRNKSVVKDMKWTADGSKISIVYEDGAVIVGSVDGNRLWGADLSMPLNFVEWSPDSRYILFVSREAQVFAYDAMGNKIKRVNLPILTQQAADNDSGKSAEEVVGIHWYDGAWGQVDPTAPTLAIALSNGKVQLTRGTDDLDPVVLDTKLAPLTQCKWNTRGTVLAVAGRLNQVDGKGELRDVAVVLFYTPHGERLRVLKAPGSGINALSWEGGGLRMALAVDSYIYFANIRPGYQWGFFADTLVYSYTRRERADSTVMFWNTDNDEKHTKHIGSLKHIKAAGDNCVLVTGPDLQGKHTLTLCNAVGAPVDRKLINIKPVHVAMTPFHVVVSDARVVYIWQYRTQVLKLTSMEAGAGTSALRKSPGRERMLDVDSFSDTPASTLETFEYPTGDAQDRIAAVTASDKNLIVARESGMLQRYTLPHISLEQKNVVRCKKPNLLRLNSDSSQLAVIDADGTFLLVDLDHTHEDGSPPGQVLPFNRQHTWDVCWAEDDPNSFAVMEKTKMFVFEKNLKEHEPTLSSGYLASYSNLEIKAVMLDEIMAKPDKPDKELVVDFEAKALEKMREFIDAEGVAEAYRAIEQNPHPRLWKLLAHCALNALDFGFADRAFVRCGDYQGIQQVKRMLSMSDKMKQRAEVAVYFGRYDDAETIYRDIDRKDLAIDLRVRLGDWFKVVALIQSGGGDDQLLVRAMTKIGEFYADRFMWGKAVQYFTQAKQLPQMAECCYRLGDFDSLQKMINLVPQGTPLLLEMANMFEGVGLHEAAVESFLKAGEVRAAIDCCVLLNQWDTAVKLAEEHNFPQIEGLLAKQAKNLMDKGEKLMAVELYRKANKATEAAKLLAVIAEEVSQEQADPLRAKKLNVLAALEVERYRKSALDMTGVTSSPADIAQNTAKTLDTLMTMDQSAGSDSRGSKILDNAWRGAAAYHYYVLAQRQLYNGQIDAAMKTSIRLAEYEDVLPPKDIYSLVALTAFHNKFFGICSRAFIKLETMPSISDQDRDQIQTLALTIFTKQSPIDPEELPTPYLDCLDTGTPYMACTASGQLIPEAGRGDRRADRNNISVSCRTCRHHALERELRQMSNCPLCHTHI